MTHPHEHLCGWIPDGGHEAHAGIFPHLWDAAYHLLVRRAEEADARPILPYRAWLDAGGYPAYVAQQIGDCTSFAHGHGNDLLQAIEYGLGNLPADALHETDTEYLYGESRKLAGLLGKPDGSYGAAVVKAMMTVGTVPRCRLGVNGAYSGARAKEWGDSGPPPDVESMAAPYKLAAAARVTCWTELVAALHHGYPVTIATARGFTLTRDRDGFCPPLGTWGHCMLIAGVRFDRPGALILQSWGPDCPTGPIAFDEPSWSFWADRRIVESILAEGDSWALSGSPGFPARSLPGSWRAA